MRLLLSCDEHCYKLGSDYYLSDFGLTLVNRYLKSFECINVAVRTKIVTSKDELGKYRNLIKNEAIKIYDMPFFQGPKQYAKCYFAVKKSAQKAVKDCEIAILRLPSTVGFAVFDVCRKQNIPYATEIVFDCYDCYESSKSILNKFLWRRLHLKQVLACNNAIGVSCVTAEYLQRRYFPLNEEAPTCNYSSIELPKEFLYKVRTFPTSESYSIIHVANQVNFNSRKGHNELIKALKLVRENGINAKLIFVGEDYEDGFKKLSEFACQNGVERFIEFTGFVSHEKLKNIMKNADLAVLPTKAEGLPRVVIEALAMGLPCITTPVSGNPELVDEDFLINYSDVDGFASCIIRFFKDKELYEKVSYINFNRSKEYTTDVLNPRRTEFYNKLKSLVTKIKKS